MSLSKKTMADLFFGVQIIGALLFCGAYAWRLRTDVVGASVAQFALVVLYLVFHIVLAINAHCDEPSRGTKQAIVMYALWLVLMLIIVGVVITNPSYQWDKKDTTTTIMGLILTLAVLATSYVQGLPLKDPMIKGFFAIAYKAVPQVLLAWKFLAEGASGVPALSIWVGHATILIRLGHLYLIGGEKEGEKEWNKGRLWLWRSEMANEASWIIATIAWLIV